MLRILTLVACLCGCTLAGLRLADRLKGRYEALCDIRAGIQSVMNAAANTNRPLAVIARELAGRGSSGFWRDFSERLTAGGSAERAWQDAFSAASHRGGPFRSLTQRDRAILDEFSATLGRMDRRSQTASGRATLEALSPQIEDAGELYAKKGRIYRVLGLFMGLGLGIMIW